MSDDDIGIIAELKLKIIALENDKDDLLSSFKKQKAEIEEQLIQKDIQIEELEDKLLQNNPNDPLNDPQEEIWKLNNHLEEIERQANQTQQNQNEIIKDLQIKNDKIKEESLAKEDKNIFLEAEIIKITQDNKTMKDSYEKLLAEENKDKNEQITNFKRKIDDLQKEKNQINEEINEINTLKKTIYELNIKYRKVMEKYEVVKEENEKLRQKYEQETAVLKQQNHNLKDENDRLPKINTMRLTPKETKRFSLMETNKIALNFDTSISLGTCDEDSDEDEKDYLEELKNIKDYYDKQLSEVKLQNIYLKSEKERLENQLEHNTNSTSNNHTPNTSSNANEIEKLKVKIKEKDKENDELIEQTILLKNDLAELTFIKESEILKLKNQLSKLLHRSNTLPNSNMKKKK